MDKRDKSCYNQSEETFCCEIISWDCWQGNIEFFKEKYRPNWHLKILEKYPNPDDWRDSINSLTPVGDTIFILKCNKKLEILNGEKVAELIQRTQVITWWNYVYAIKTKLLLVESAGCVFERKKNEIAELFNEYNSSYNKKDIEDRIKRLLNEMSELVEIIEMKDYMKNNNKKYNNTIREKIIIMRKNIRDYNPNVSNDLKIKQNDIINTKNLVRNLETR